MHSVVMCSILVHMAAQTHGKHCPSRPSRVYLVRWMVATVVAVVAFILGYWLGWSRDSGWALAAIPVIIAAVTVAVCSAGLWGRARAEEIAQGCSHCT